MLISLNRPRNCQKLEIAPVPKKQLGLEMDHKLNARQQYHPVVKRVVISVRRHRMETCKASALLHLGRSALKCCPASGQWGRIQWRSARVFL